jgi:hypothetical protein
VALFVNGPRNLHHYLLLNSIQIPTQETQLETERPDSRILPQRASARYGCKLVAAMSTQGRTQPRGGSATESLSCRQ